MMKTKRLYQQTTMHPLGVPEDDALCVATVVDGYAVGERQCRRKRGFGHEGEYCPIHAKQHPQEYDAVEMSPGTLLDSPLTLEVCLPTSSRLWKTKSLRLT